MYKPSEATSTSIKLNNSYVGEYIEAKMRRIIDSKEPITDSSPIIYTERKNGVEPQYNIRTDRWDIAIDAMDSAAKSYKAKREGKIKERDLGEEAKKGIEAEKLNERQTKLGNGGESGA